MNKTKFNTQNEYKPTQEDIENSIRISKEYNTFGIPQGIFSSKDSKPIYSKEELKAMWYINNNKPLPKELEEHLINTKQERMSLRPPTVEITPPTDEELLDFLNS